LERWSDLPVQKRRRGARLEIPMPRGDKSSYTDKQKRMAEHIEEGYEKRGVSENEAERRAWATVIKETHGGKKSGSGRGKPEDHSPSRMGAPAAKLQPAGPPQSVPRPQRRPLALVRNTPHKSKPLRRLLFENWRYCALPSAARRSGAASCRTRSEAFRASSFERAAPSSPVSPSSMLERSSIGTYASTVAKRRRAS
jgi:plasmid stabilization system protein ParE